MAAGGRVTQVPTSTTWSQEGHPVTFAASHCTEGGGVPRKHEHPRRWGSLGKSSGSVCHNTNVGKVWKSILSAPHQSALSVLGRGDVAGRGGSGYTCVTSVRALSPVHTGHSVFLCNSSCTAHSGSFTVWTSLILGHH